MLRPLPHAAEAPRPCYTSAMTGRRSTHRRPKSEATAPADVAPPHPEPVGTAPRNGADGEWLTAIQAQRILGATSERVIQVWADYGWLRSRRDPAGRLEVLRD